MKIVEVEAQGRRMAYTAIYPWIEQDGSTILPDDDPYAGEEMGCLEVSTNGAIDLNYGWEDPPRWTIEMAEQLARALDKAVEIARSRTATALTAKPG